MRSIEHTWLCAISHIFHITGSDVKLVSDFTGTVAFGEMLQCRKMQFLDGLRYLIQSILTKKIFLPGHWGGGGWAPRAPLVYAIACKLKTA